MPEIKSHPKVTWDFEHIYIHDKTECEPGIGPWNDEPDEVKRQV